MNPQPCQIIITVFPDGRMDVRGPADLVVFYGMVERAKDIMREHNAKGEAIKAEPKRIVTPIVPGGWPRAAS